MAFFCKPITTSCSILHAALRKRLIAAFDNKPNFVI